MDTLQNYCLIVDRFVSGGLFGVLLRRCCCVTPACLHGCTQIVVFGGHGGRTRYYRDVHLYDLEAKKWSKPSTVGAGPSKRSGHAMTRIGRQYVGFGCGGEIALLAAS